jgi:prevent-host-death family protein
MKQIGVYEAKTKLASLLDEVENGATVTITRHGKPIARLVPVERSRQDIEATIAAIRALRKGNKLDGITIKELIEEGRT